MSIFVTRTWKDDTVCKYIMSKYKIKQKHSVQVIYS